MRDETLSVPVSFQRSEAEERSERFDARILLAEDNRVNQRVAQGMLEYFGCQVDIASDGQEAMEALSRNSYDLILMDCQMPRIDGYQVAQALRSMEASDQGNHSHIPIIALTAEASEESRQQCIAAGMDDYLAKPFTREELRGILRAWLHRKGSERQEERSPSQQGESLHSASGVDGVDRRTLESIRALQREGESDLLSRVIEAYFGEADRLFQILREAVKKGDGEALRKAAHSLKASSANVGAWKLSTLCKELEIIGWEKSIEKAASLLSEAVVEYEVVQKALHAEMKRRDGGKRAS
ncbi:MAG: response regulator [Syntrophaceae bacterium]|nr:response regulator [Syntrophaceae bacterium]